MNSKPMLLALTMSLAAASAVWAADEPAAQTATPASQPASAQPAAAATSASSDAAKPAATAAAKDAAAADKEGEAERHLLARGYKKETHGSQTVYCRKEIKTGSHFETKVCGTAESMALAEQQARDLMQNSQNSSGSRVN
jgi:hypothetical protein